MAAFSLFGVTLHKHLFQSMAIRLGFVFLSLVTTLILSRLLGLSIFGEFTFYLSSAFLISGLALSGGVGFTVRETAKSDTVAGAFKVLKFTLFVGCCAGLLAIISLFFVMSSSVSEFLMLHVSILVALQIVHALLSASLRGLGEINLGQYGDLILRPIIFNILVLICFAYFEVVDAKVAIELQIYASLTATLFTLYYLLKSFWGKVDITAPFLEMKWLTSMFQLASISWLAVANAHLLIIMTGLLSNAENVGLLRVAIQCALIVSLSLSAIEIAQAPKYAKSAKLDDKHELHKLLQQSCVLAGVISGASGLLVLLLIKPILLYLFGAEFTGAARATQVVVLAYIFNAMTGNVGILLIAINEERKAAVGSLLALIVMTLFAFWLIPIYGVLGAAIALAFALTVRNIYNLILCWSLTSIIALPFAPYVEQET